MDRLIDGPGRIDWIDGCRVAMQTDAVGDGKRDRVTEGGGGGRCGAASTRERERDRERERERRERERDRCGAASTTRAAICAGARCGRSPATTRKPVEANLEERDRERLEANR